MSSVLNLNYHDALDKIDSYDEYVSELKKVEDRMYWEKATNKNTKRAYEKYLKNYYNGLYSNEAKRKVDEFIRFKKEKALEKQRLRDIEIAKERAKLEKIEKEKKLALDKEKEAWKLVCKKNTKENYENYLKFYPDGIYYLEANQNIQKIVNIEARKIREIAVKEEDKVWEKACKEDNSWSYSEYMEKYPNGIYFDEAQSLSEMLNIEITLKKYPKKRLFIFQTNIKKGVIARNKQIIIEAKYDDILKIGERFIVVKNNEQQGLYSVDGAMILELGNYNLRVDGGGYKTDIIEQLNPNNDFQVSAISDDKQLINQSSFMKMFDTSVIKIIDIKNYTFGYISNDDKLLFEPIYTDIYLYKNGLGRILKKGGKHSLCGLINNKYELILDCNYGHIQWKSNDSNYTVIQNKDWSKQGIVNIQGEIVIDFLFDSIEDLDNGYFIAYKGDKSESLKYGLIDLKGKIIIDVVYSHITYLKNENIFLLYKDKKFGFTNNKGKITVDPELEFEHSNTDFMKYYFRGHVFDEKESLLLVKKNGKLGLVNKNGEYVLYPIYDTIDGYDNKYLKVMFVREKHKSGFVDKKGKFILDLDTYELNKPYDYSNISTIKLRNINPLFGLINWYTGKIILPMKYKSLSCEHIDKKIYKFTSGLKSGLIDENGKILLDLVNFIKFNLLKKEFL